MGTASNDTATSNLEPTKSICLSSLTSLGVSQGSSYSVQNRQKKQRAFDVRSFSKLRYLPNISARHYKWLLHLRPIVRLGQMQRLLQYFQRVACSLASTGRHSSNSRKDVRQGASPSVFKYAKIACALQRINKSCLQYLQDQFRCHLGILHLQGCRH